MCIKLSHLINRIRPVKFMLVLALLSGVLGPMAHAEGGQCISLFLSDEEEVALQVVKTKLGFIQRRAGVEQAATRKVEKFSVISATAEAEMIEIIKQGTGPNLLLEEIDINTKGAWDLLVKRKTTVEHLDEVIEVLSTTVDGFRRIKGIDHAKVLSRIKGGLLETLKVSVAQMSPEEVAVFVIKMRGLLRKKATDFREMIPILSYIKKLKVPGSGWIVMLAELNDLILRKEWPGKPRDQMTEGVFAIINESFESLNQISNMNLDRYFEYALSDPRILIPLLKSKVSIPEIFHFRFAFAFSDLLSDMNRRRAGHGFLIAKELRRRGIAKNDALHFVNMVIDHGSVFIEPNVLIMYRELKAELEK